jgi:transcription initiation factor TFIIE subunit beta
MCVEVVGCSDVVYNFICCFSKDLKESGDILWLSGTDPQEGVVYGNDDPRSKIMVDEDVKQLYETTDLPRDMLDIEKELHKAGVKTQTNTAERRQQALVHGAQRKPTKSKKKPRGLTSMSRITNSHLPELFANMNS